MSNSKSIYDLIAERTFSTEAPSPCVTCKRNVSILPLRYAVIGNTPAKRSQLLAAESADITGHLAALPLSTAHYAVRLLRDGYLYLFVQRIFQDWACEGAYQTYNSGLCKPFWPTEEEQQRYGAMPNLGDRVIQIPDPEDVDEARLLFTPDLLTPQMLNEIRTNPQLRNTLRKLDIRQLMISCRYKDHVIEAHELDSTLAESLGQASAPLTHLMADQLFPYPAGYAPLAGVHSRLTPTERDAQGFAVVLDDPIGITQELNAWRNQSAADLEAFMQTTDDEGISNQRKHSIAFAIENLKTTLAERAEQQHLKHLNSLGVVYTDPEYTPASGTLFPVMASLGNARRYRNPADQQEQVQQELEQARKDSWDDKYASSIDEPRRQAFLAEFQAAVERADRLKEERAADHLSWLKSQAFLEAFACYDRHDSRSGLDFEAQLGAAVAGMNGTPQGDAQIHAWSNVDKVSPDNWYWRGLGQNQTAALGEINRLLAQRDELPNLDSGALQGLAKSLSDIYDKAHALVNEVQLNTVASSIRVSGAVLLTNTFGTRLLQSSPAAKLDGPLNTLLALVFKARLGQLGEQLHFENRNVPLSAGVKTKIGLAASHSFGDGPGTHASSASLDIRLGSTLALLNVWNLKLKAEKEEKGTREYIELTAAIVAVSAAGLELGGIAVSRGESSPNAAIRQAARLMGSELKLMAGVLAAGAMVVGAVYDYEDVASNVQKGKSSLAGLYFLRAAAQGGAAVFSFAIGLAVAGPYLERLIQIHGRNHFLVATHKLSAHLALRMAFMLRWCVRINVAIFVLTVALEFLQPDALQNYLRHSTFRKDRSNGTSKTEEQELKNFRNAVEGTL
jgi:hypothetical protein